MVHVAEGAIDHAGDELAAGDEEGVDGDQLTPLVMGGHFSNVHRNCHRGNAWKGNEWPVSHGHKQKKNFVRLCKILMQ